MDISFTNIILAPISNIPPGDLHNCRAKRTSQMILGLFPEIRSRPLQASTTLQEPLIGVHNPVQL